jgi:hypothetical protein
MSGHAIEPPPATPNPEATDRPEESFETRPEEQIEPAVPANEGRTSCSSFDELSALLIDSNPDPLLDVVEKEACEGTRTSPKDSDSATEQNPTGSLLGDSSVQPAPAQRPKTNPTASSRSPLFSFLPASRPQDEQNLRIDIRLTPEPERSLKSAGGGLESSAECDASEDLPESGRFPWLFLLLSSYASALTLVLLWLLATGRGSGKLSGSGSDGRAVQLELPPSQARITHEPIPPLPQRNLAALGIPIRLGELEFVGLAVVQRPVELIRLDGSTGEFRDSFDCLVLEARIANRSKSVSFSPLDPAFVRDPGTALDQCVLVTPGGGRLPMFPLAIESEWSIRDQFFPRLAPGEEAQTILVTEPIRVPLPDGVLTWQVKVRTGPYQTDVVGIQFRSGEIVTREW